MSTNAKKEKILIKTMTALQPELRFPDYEMDGPWVVAKIGDYLTESRVKGNKGDVAKKLTVKLWGKGVFEKDEPLSGSSNTQYFKRRAGQFIYSKLDFLNQAFGIIPISLDGYESTVDLPCFDASEGLDLRFLLNYVQRKDFYKKVGEIADGGRKAKRIQVHSFLNFSITLPTLPEQKRIADTLSSLDQLITAHTKKLDTLRTHKKALMQNLFPAEGKKVPKLRFPKFRASGNWEITSIGDKIDLLSGFPFKGKDLSDDKNGVPILRGINITEGYIRHNDEIDKYFLGNVKQLEKYYLKKDDLVIGMDGSKVGKNSALIDAADVGSLLIQRVARLRSTDKIDIRFLFHRINSSVFHEYVDRVNSSGGIPHISAKQIQEFTISLPTLPEQKRIADFLTSIDNLINAQAQKIESLKAHKKGLMQRLFPVMESA